MATKIANAEKIISCVIRWLLAAIFSKNQLYVKLHVC